MDNTTSEKRIQAEAFQRAWNLYPQTRRLIFHVPNGGSRNKIEGMQLKAQGVVAGIPDMLFIWKGKLYAFEFKTSNGKLSQAQMKVHTTWTDHGAEPFIVRSPDEFVSLIGKIIDNN